jgi:hypothetical protein
MAEILPSDSEPSNALSIEDMPKAALQAIYAAVTGKTERLSKRLRGNVRICFADVERLHDGIKQHIEHLEILAPPTVTVVVKAEDAQSFQHSSWEHFQKLQPNTLSVTSELTIKIEFVMVLPKGVGPQRLVMTVNLDSSLPIIAPVDEGPLDDPMADFIVALGDKWPTCFITIDFVDFLVAQRFSGVVENWFSDLEKIPVSGLNMMLVRSWGMVRELFEAGALLGFAAFLVGYVLFTGDATNSLRDAILAGAVGVGIYAFSKAIVAQLRTLSQKKIASNIMPSVILLTEGDRRRLAQFEGRRAKSGATIWSILGSTGAAIMLNLAASYIFTYLTK